MGVAHGERFDWTDERLELLKKLWGEGRSGSQIADELGGGVTRCAVLGKANRLGLSKEKKVARTKTKTTRRAQASERRDRSTNGAGTRPGELSDAEKTRLIERTVVPAVTVTDEEVAAEVRRRMLYSRFTDDARPDFSWPSAHRASSKAGFVPKCTQEVAGMLPCGRPTVGRTARCELHGGTYIAKIKHTGGETETLEVAVE